ncbi:protein expanded [Anabrus simplex]|uniref:protein expanded n=1 Tax=Anabrus simplex TaxID=316456 RepID=UPI0035A2FBA9
MRSCTVSAPVQSCGAPLTSSSKKYAAVELLTKQRLYFVVEAKSRAKELYCQTCAHLSSQGMQDCELFGLATVSDGEYLFVDPENKLSKYAPKHWKSSHTHGLDGNGRPSLVLYFRVQFYVDSPLLLRDEVTRHHYYLQLRDNVLHRGLLHACSSQEVLYLLAGYALQADLGDYNEERHVGSYFQPADYFPQQMVSGENQLLQTVPALHRDNSGISKGEAERQYIREASSPEVSPLTHNSHLYRLKHKKQEQGQGSVWLAICAKGIHIYEENSTKTLTATFLWNNIGKLCFDRKKFEIRALNWPASGEKFTYYTSSDEKSKHLLFLCRVTHQFSMAIQPRLSEVRRREEEERKRMRDCYMYSRSLGSDFPTLAKLGGNYKVHHSDQRISVISNTSSNTTSGIVSDRVQSLDESEDDLEIEIMINSPPAPSVESLALAHLRDAPDMGQSSPQLQGDADELEGVSSAGVSAHPQKSSPSSSTGAGGAATPATTDGSQCSSSCSTVVVAGATLAPSGSSTSQTTRELMRRRASTSSSLELGYSHTAQNSAVSDSASTCLELDYSVQSAHTSSGIYTLTTADTNPCSSETSGVYAICSNDSTDSGRAFPGTGGMRDRSGSSAASVVSASGSFRGDGSDPSDAGPRSPLTAEELSDLIVGRGSGSEHTSGVYPPRTTVSVNMDSDSDYVTLPPPPLPPPRTDSDTNYVMLEPVCVSPVENMQEARSPPPPPPYNSQPLPTIPNLELLSQSQQSLLSQQQQLLNQPLPPPPPLSRVPPAEEANARFITTRPHINILTAHTTLVAPTAAPSFAAPTLTYQPSGTQQMRLYPPGDARTHPPTHIKTVASPRGVSVPQTPVASTPYSSYSAVPDPGAKMKPAAVQTLVPIIGKNNYLDVHASRTSANTNASVGLLRSTVTMSSPSSSYQIHQRHFSPPPPPPPVIHPRQPPPPPPQTSPPNLATVYTSQVTRSQIEQFQQQMYSDVDYVIYPMQDPAISKQEYIDAKQGSMIAHSAAHYPPPPYPSYHTSPKGHYMYRSTPNVAVAAGGYLPMTFSNAPIPSGVKYASNQNLSSEPSYNAEYLTPSHYSASTSPLYSAAASYSSSSTQSLRYEPSHQQFSELLHQLGVSKMRPPPPTPLSSFTRARSDDNILNSYEKPATLLERPKYRRLPPPPPPPPYDQQITENVSLSEKPPPPPPPADVAHSPSAKGAEAMLDIRTLREKSKNLDLPLISALCNDRSLLKQTNAFVMPRHPTSGGRKCVDSERPVSWHTDSTSKVASSASVAMEQKGTGTLLSSLLSNRSMSGSSNSKLKYPVSGLSTTQISKPQRKVSASTHIHPHHDLMKVVQAQPSSVGKKQLGRSGSNNSGTGVIQHRDTIVP